jgi:hypothetical protein
MLSLPSSYAFVSDWNDTPPSAGPAHVDYRRRALGIWPGLDRTRLRRTKGDPWRIANLVATRTSLAHEDILVLLMGLHDATGHGGNASHDVGPHSGATSSHQTR